MTYPDPKPPLFAQVKQDRPPDKPSARVFCPACKDEVVEFYTGKDRKQKGHCHGCGREVECENA